MTQEESKVFFIKFISTLSKRRWCRCYSLFLSLWNRALVGKYTVPQSAEKLFSFYGRERSLLCSE